MKNLSNTKYGLHGKLKAVKGKGDELAAILIKASQVVSNASGCLLYIVSKDLSENDTIWITEAWENKENHDNSLKLDEVRQLIMKAMPLLDGNPEKGQELEVLGGLGI